MDDEIKIKVDEIFKDWAGGIDQLRQICKCGKHLLVTFSIPLDLLKEFEVDISLHPLE